MISDIGKNQFRHQGYSLSVFINFSNFLDLVETYLNTTLVVRNTSVEVKLKHSPLYV